MKARDLLLAALLLVTGFLLYDSSRASEDLRSLRLAVDAPRAGAAKRERGNPAMFPAILHAAPVPDGSAPAGVASPPARIAPAPVEPVPITMTDHIAHIETVFGEQSDGGGWAREATLKLEQGLSRIAKGTRDLGQVECKSSLCRAHYTGDDPAKCEDFARDAVHQTAPYFWEGPYTVKINPASEGTRCSVAMMFGRQGTDLPSTE